VRERERERERERGRGKGKGGGERERFRERKRNKAGERAQFCSSLSLLSVFFLDELRPNEGIVTSSFLQDVNANATVGRMTDRLRKERLPDCIKKALFGYILEGLGMENVSTFYGR
jgi:hypothetical protein